MASHIVGEVMALLEPANDFNRLCGIVFMMLFCNTNKTSTIYRVLR